MSNAAPLDRFTILVTRSAGQSSQFARLLQAQGATVLEMPTLEITPPSSWEGLDQAIDHLPEFDWLILTSTNAVDYFFDRLSHQGQDTRALAGVKVAVVGQKTAGCLQQHGLQPDYIPPNFVADALVEQFPDADRLPGLRVLFPRVESGGREVLVREFTNGGAIVTEVAAYQSSCVRSLVPEVETALRQQTIDVVTFASSKTVRCFAQLLQPFPELRSANFAIASIGPQTSVDCREQFGRVDIEASTYTLEGLTAAIVDWAQTQPDQTQVQTQPSPLPTQQRIIGITGGIGMGKTTVSNYLSEQHHLPVLDADVLARDAVQPGSQVLTEIVDRYGSSILQANGTLDRQRLGNMIFSSPPERVWLEQRIHPYVRQQLQENLSQLRERPIVVLVIPLLFEARMTDLVTEIWLVRSSTDQQASRLQQRDQLTPEQIQARISSQMSIEKKADRADVILDNSTTVEALFAQIDRALLGRSV